MSGTILVLRHGPTDWSSQKRLQGRTDLPLSDAGRLQVALWRLPPFWQRAHCLCSPLARAVQTAALLGFEPQIEPALIEADWGGFEGKTLDELRLDPEARMAEREALGMDFCPPDGESPRQVAGRIRPLFNRADQGTPQIWVTHKGVRNACLILAMGWDMRTKPPIKLGNQQGLILSTRLEFIDTLELRAA